MNFFHFALIFVLDLTIKESDNLLTFELLIENIVVDVKNVI